MLWEFCKIVNWYRNNRGMKECLPVCFDTNADSTWWVCSVTRKRVNATSWHYRKRLAREVCAFSIAILDESFPWLSSDHSHTERMLYSVQNIFVGTSSRSSDVDYYVFIRSLLNTFCSVRSVPKHFYWRCLIQNFLESEFLLSDWRALKDVWDIQYHRQD